MEVGVGHVEAVVFRPSVFCFALVIRKITTQSQLPLGCCSPQESTGFQFFVWNEEYVGASVECEQSFEITYIIRDLGSLSVFSSTVLAQFNLNSIISRSENSVNPLYSLSKV